MAAPGPTIRRLMKEAQELSEHSPSPSPFFHAHPISDSNLFDWHFTLAGPPSPSPYANGIYHGRIVLSPQYPLRPPSFRFLTPSGRFEINREICLSISGHHDETWQPAWGIRTALTAIRSFMDGDAKGQVGGMEAREELRREWAKMSREWKCDVCSGGKTNEQILNEWWDVCRSKGVDVGEREDQASALRETVPEGLKVGYRDEKPEKKPDEMPKNDVVRTHGLLSSPAKGRRSRLGEVIAGGGSSASSSRAEYTPVGPSVPTASSTTAVSLERRTGVFKNLNANPTTSLHNHSTRRTWNDIWLDGAIVAVLVSLVALILRKMFHSSWDEI